MVATTEDMTELIEDICKALAGIEATDQEKLALSGCLKRSTTENDSPEEAIFRAYRERQLERETERLWREEVAKKAAQLRQREEAKAKLAKWPPHSDVISQDLQPRQAVVQPKLMLGKEERFFSCSFACCLIRL